MFNCRASCCSRVSLIEQTGSLFADILRNIANIAEFYRFRLIRAIIPESNELQSS